MIWIKLLLNKSKICKFRYEYMKKKYTWIYRLVTKYTNKFKLANKWINIDE